VDIPIQSLAQPLPGLALVPAGINTALLDTNVYGPENLRVWDHGTYMRDVWRWREGPALVARSACQLGDQPYSPFSISRLHIVPSLDTMAPANNITRSVMGSTKRRADSFIVMLHNAVCIEAVPDIHALSTSVVFPIHAQRGFALQGVAIARDATMQTCIFRVGRMLLWSAYLLLAFAPSLQIDGPVQNEAR